MKFYEGREEEKCDGVGWRREGGKRRSFMKRGGGGEKCYGEG